MLVFDQLKKSDPRLRLLAVVILVALGVLLAGLWWVQVVRARDYRARLETQSFRTVRIPSARGKILDRHGVALADNRPSYDVCLYLEDLRRAFDAAYSRQLAQVRSNRAFEMAAREREVGRRLKADERKRFLVTAAERNALRQQARFAAASNIVAQVSARMQMPAQLDPRRFLRHYNEQLVLPLRVLPDLDAARLARFLEFAEPLEGVDLDVQPLRHYPFGSTAAHLLGQMRHDVSSAEGEDAFLNYPLPVLRGTVGVEAAFDRELRGRSGAKSVLVNNLGYRQSENVWTPALPGDSVVLTIDLGIQQAAERALRQAGAQVRGAVVVLDPRNGDLLAMVSAPAYDPNLFIRGLTHPEWEALSDPKQRPQINRAVQENYAPGSIFKIVTALACLESGLPPKARLYNPPHPYNPNRGHIKLGRRIIDDTAPPGDYDFRRAFLKSSNTYFVSNGLRAGIQAILRVSRDLHLGELTGLPTRQEVPGILPDLRQVSLQWADGDTANICLGQGPLAVTPLQMAVMTAAIANGGKVFWPRLVDRVQTQDTLQPQVKESFPAGRVRNQLSVRPQTLELIREAMVADTEDEEGTGFVAFHERDRRTPRLKEFRVGGKTGTAQVTNERNQVVDHTVWFVSFAPHDEPRYVVVVMIESGGSGGGTAAPVACSLYDAILKLQQQRRAPRDTLAQGHP